MTYAPGIKEFVERCNLVLPRDFYLYPLSEQRRLYESYIYEFRFERPDNIDIWDDEVRSEGREVPIRVYCPHKREGRGVILYMHGGGFVIGSIATHDTFVAEMASRTGLTCISIDFRLAPEYPFPAALEDCYGAFCAIVEDAGRFDIDINCIGVSGDSSGGNLCVGVCLMTRDRQGSAIKAQILISPVLDFARWESGGEDVPLLSSGEMVFFTKCYVGDTTDIKHPLISPLRGAQLYGLPPAYIMATERDSLCIDSLQYAEQLSKYGTPVELVVESGLVHACIRARGMSTAVAEAVDRIFNATRSLMQ